MAPKILIVEDELRRHEEWKRALGDTVQIISAYTVEEGERFFTENPDVALIAMDACVPGDSPTTLGLTRRIRAMFSGPMVAISGDSDYRKMLMRAGCSHECPKGRLPDIIRQLLHL